MIHDAKMFRTSVGFAWEPNVLSISSRGGKQHQSIRLHESKCPNLHKILLQKASQFKISSPCTNHPIWCPLCPIQNPMVWKYNLRAHITHNHPTANHKLYKDFYQVPDKEITLLKAAYLDKTVKCKHKQNHPL